MSPRPALVGLLLAAATLPLAAQTAVPAPPVLAQPQAGAWPEPRAEHVVIDEKGSRIDELHVGGEVRSIQVQPKNGGKAYEIMPATGGRDLSNSHSNSRGAAGQRVWSVLKF